MLRDKLGLDLGCKSVPWAAEEEVTPATLPAEAVVLCLPHPIQQRQLVVESKQEAAFACIFLLFYLVPEPSLYYLLKSLCLTLLL